MLYRPRRASKRWLDGDCPPEVLAIFDSVHNVDRYTVFYVPTDLGELRDTWICYRAMSVDPLSPFGVGISGDMQAYEVVKYRRRFYRQYTTWTSLPDAVKQCVRRDAASMSN